MTSLADFAPATLAQQFAEWGYKPSHAAPVLRAFYEGRAIMTSPTRGLPQGLVERLNTTFPTSATTLAARQVAADGTTKLLLRLADGRTVESVLIPDFRADRAAGCISSQVGCAMGCDFCATTKTGFERNLTAGEIIEQFLALRREASAVGRKLQTVVFMGMGEPCATSTLFTYVSCSPFRVPVARLAAAQAAIEEKRKAAAAKAKKK